MSPDLPSRFQSNGFRDWTSSQPHTAFPSTWRLDTAKWPTLQGTRSQVPACQHDFLLKGQPRGETPVLMRMLCCPTYRCPQPRTCGELRHILRVAIQAGLLHGIDGVPQEFMCILLVPEPEVPGNFCRKKGMQEGDDWEATSPRANTSCHSATAYTGFTVGSTFLLTDWKAGPPHNPSSWLLRPLTTHPTGSSSPPSSHVHLPDSISNAAPLLATA